MLQIVVHIGNEVLTQMCNDRKYRIYVLDRFCTEMQTGAACCSLVVEAIVT